jgi:hypothetical protein
MLFKSLGSIQFSPSADHLERLGDLIDGLELVAHALRTLAEHLVADAQGRHRLLWAVRQRIQCGGDGLDRVQRDPPRFEANRPSSAPLPGRTDRPR